MIDIIPELRPIFLENGINLIPSDEADSNTKFPCVTYREQSNIDERVGDNVGYSNVSYIIEVWDYDFEAMTETCNKVDKVMKQYKFTRYMSEKQAIDSLHRKILGYRRLIKENY